MLRFGGTAMAFCGEMSAARPNAFRKLNLLSYPRKSRNLRPPRFARMNRKRECPQITQIAADSDASICANLRNLWTLILGIECCDCLH